MACGPASDARSARQRARAAAANPFPSRDSLTKLAGEPLKPIPVQPVASAPAWNVVIDTSDAASPAEARFAEIASKADAKLTYTKELRCVARELARFQAEHGALPNERLKRFMVGACGVTDPGVGALTQLVTLPSDGSDDQALAEWQRVASVPPELKSNAVGVWMARNNTRVSIVVAFAPSGHNMEVSPVDASGAFTVQGTVPPGTEYAIGLVNQQQGVANCEADATTPAPLFAFHCKMHPADQTAWVAVATRAEGRLLMRSRGLGLARRDASAPLSFVASTRTPRPVTSPQDLQSAVLDGINQARVAAKLNRVSLASTQTATNERLAPHFFVAYQKNDVQTTELVGLGLLAGWDVDGTIKRGNLFTAMLTGTTDANDWLDYALEAPMGRLTMLAADARQIAIGVPAPGSVGGLGAIVTSYDMFTSNDHRGDAAVVFSQIQNARAKRGLPPPTRIEGIPALTAYAQLVNEGKRDAEEALDGAMVAVRDHAQRSVRGWVVSSNQLEAVPLPPELLAPGPLEIAVEVTHHKDEGAAWGSYVVFLVTTSISAPTSTPTIQATSLRTTKTF
ncbi:hypothetical protein AKJ09_10944 [Labilithrix luteola]|uniref:Uncharacterized protein n=2 Tax=Labilithrix luteola TaxID=1391654 RepID=A0A0K1QEU2_9BACT|nr:hypothetical protein AKJ09_10944 [Labilithrix luteola]